MDRDQSQPGEKTYWGRPPRRQQRSMEEENTGWHPTKDNLIWKL